MAPTILGRTKMSLCSEVPQRKTATGSCKEQSMTAQSVRCRAKVVGMLPIKLNAAFCGYGATHRLAGQTFLCYMGMCQKPVTTASFNAITVHRSLTDMKVLNTASMLPAPQFNPCSATLHTPLGGQPPFGHGIVASLLCSSPPSTCCWFLCGSRRPLLL